MSLEHILLGLLQNPAAGYDLRREFEQGARHFWSAELAQIYPTLAGMERKGWLTSRRMPSDNGPPRRVYRRTAQGTRELNRWLAGEPIMGVERFAYLAQLIFMGELHDRERTRGFIEQLRAKQAELLSKIQGGLDEIAMAHPDGESPLSDELFHAKLCLELSARAVGARVQWCDETLARFAKTPSTSTRRRSKSRE